MRRVKTTDIASKPSLHAGVVTNAEVFTYATYSMQRLKRGRNNDENLGRL
jgi:hypothetical protein